ncbi:MAG: hypothetical protein ACO3VH_07310, partial [Ilumatobacteraceae bacterium]
SVARVMKPCRTSCGVKRLALFHHDPERTDDELDAFASCSAGAGAGGPEVFAAREGQGFLIAAGRVVDYRAGDFEATTVGALLAAPAGDPLGGARS